MWRLARLDRFVDVGHADGEIETGRAQQLGTAWRCGGQDDQIETECYSRRVIPLQQFMPAALAEILRKAPLTPEKINFAWRSAVGPAVDAATSIELRNGVLYVTTRDASWQRELERSAGLIRSRLTATLGNVIRTIEVSRA